MKASRVTPLLAAAALAISVLALVVASLALRQGTPTPADPNPAATRRADAAASASDDASGLPAPTARTSIVPVSGPASRIAVHPFAAPLDESIDLRFVEVPPVPGPWMLRGVVTSASGAAVAGQHVLVADPHVFRQFGNLDVLRQWFHAPPPWTPTYASAPRVVPPDEVNAEGLNVTTTDANGHFELEVQASSGHAAVFVSHDELGDAYSGDLTLARDHSTDIALQLTPVHGVFGTVTEAGTGKPAARVEISFWPSIGTDSHGMDVHLETDANGCWWYAPVPAQRASVMTDRYGWHRASAEIDLTTPGLWHRADIVIECKRTLSGRLIDAAGVPVDLLAAVRAAGRDPAGDPFVLLTPEDPSTVPDIALYGGYRPRIDTRGGATTYGATIDFKPVRWVSLWCGHDVMLGATHFDLEDDGNDVDIVVNTSLIKPRIPPEGAIALHVFDAVTGTPVDAYAVQIAQPASDNPTLDGFGVRREGSARHAGGRTTVVDLRAGLCRVVVSAEGYAEGTSVVSVPAEGAVQCRIALRPAVGSISGVIQGDENTPRTLLFPPLRLLRAGTTPDRGAAYAFAPVYTDGSFSFDNIAEGDYVVVGAWWSRSGSPLVAAVPARAHPTSEKLVVRFMPGAAISFAPTGAAGPFGYRVVDAADVVWFDNRFDRPSGGFISTWPAAGVTVPPGKYTVECWCPNFETARVGFTATAGVQLKIPVPLTAAKR